MFASLAVASPAFADVPPPDTSGCNMKVAGDACQKDDMSAGTCGAQTCTKLDYSMGTPPKTVEYACLVCTSSGSAGGSPSNNGGSADDGGCSVRHGGVVGAMSAWVLGAAVLLLSRRSRARVRKTHS